MADTDSQKGHQHGAFMTVIGVRRSEARALSGVHAPCISAKHFLHRAAFNRVDHSTHLVPLLLPTHVAELNGCALARFSGDPCGPSTNLEVKAFRSLTTSVLVISAAGTACASRQVELRTSLATLASSVGNQYEGWIKP